MKTLKGFLIATAMLCTVHNVQAQDSTALINTIWSLYANDTNNTFKQSVIYIDSMFAAAGYTDSLYSQNPQQTEQDDIPFFQYQKWKNFWATRLDDATGKPHNYAAEMSALIKVGSSPWLDCAELSDLQNSFGSILPGGKGWHYIGPQNITDPSYYGCHLGRVLQIIVNPSARNEIYIVDNWGGIWKTTDGTTFAGGAPHWVCISDNNHTMAGIGASKLMVDFTTIPYTLVYIVGQTNGPNCMLYLYSKPITAGIAYSYTDGSTWSFMPLPTSIINLSTENINDIKMWPGNTTSPTKYMFFSTSTKVVRADITAGMATPVFTVLTDITTSPMFTPGENIGSRFVGYNEITFQSGFPSTLFVATYSNWGEYYPSGSYLFQINNCACATCTSFPSSDITNVITPVVAGCPIGTNEYTSLGACTSITVNPVVPGTYTPAYTWYFPVPPHQQQAQLLYPINGFLKLHPVESVCHMFF